MIEPSRAWRGSALRAASLLIPCTLLGLLLAGVPVRAQGGLLGRYYDEPDLSDLADERLDPTVDFSGWSAQPPGTAVAPDASFSERWTGSVLLDDAGLWTFRTLSNDGVRLWVDDVLLIERWDTHSAILDAATLALGAGWHALRLEHFQDGGSATIRLEFEGPGQPAAVIPASKLDPGPPNLFPVVELGPLKTIVQPGTSLVLTAEAADPDGEVTGWTWEQLSGPPATLLTPDQPELLVTDCTSLGSYVFRLTVEDDGGAQASDELTVQVIDRGPLGGTIQGDTRVWQALTLALEGPLVDELGEPNPFLDHRVDVTFVHVPSGTTHLVPGAFAADGQAQDSGASAGRTWHTHLAPDLEGAWFYRASHRTGDGVAVDADPLAGSPGEMDGISGTFQVAALDPEAEGFRGDGRLVFTGEGHHWRFSGSGRPFLEGGANSPENLLAYGDFDDTVPSHAFQPHLGDWLPGDPTWAGGRGRGLVGALRYLATEGMNGVYMMFYNVDGDGDDVWPWTERDERLRYDVSKLAQWEVVFTHMDDLGLALHAVLQDDDLLGPDDGDLGTERRLYTREMVARFGHHLGLIWNLGEETVLSPQQLEDWWAHLRGVDPFDHPVVVHTVPGGQGAVWDPLLSAGALEGASLQVEDAATVHEETVAWRLASEAAGRPWAVRLDELGPADDGVLPDSVDPEHDVPRRALWEHLVGGGAAVSWYFGYAWPDDDLDCEDWRSRAEMWRLTRLALMLFETAVPYAQMAPADEQVSGAGCHLLAAPGLAYVVYRPGPTAVTLHLGADPGTYDVRWFDPRAGGALQQGSVTMVRGPGSVDLGAPPAMPQQDWVVVVEVDPPTGDLTTAKLLDGGPGDAPDNLP